MMKSFYASYRDVVLHGMVTTVQGNVGTVLFDGEEQQSAYFDLHDGCRVDFNEGRKDRAPMIKFTQTTDIKHPVPYPHGQDAEYEIVVVLSNRDNNWAYIWAYENEYMNVVGKLIKIIEERLEAAEKRRLEENRLRLQKRQALDQLSALGLFRIAKAHKFLGENERRPAKPATGPMRLHDLLLAIARGQVPFALERATGNDTLFMWFERLATGGGWVKTVLDDEMLGLLAETLEGESGFDEIQAIIDRLPIAESAAVRA